jgi:hypothetical protein
MPAVTSKATKTLSARRASDNSTRSARSEASPAGPSSNARVT